jgi:hypothetical protein
MKHIIPGDGTEAMMHLALVVKARVRLVFYLASFVQLLVAGARYSCT